MRLVLDTNVVASALLWNGTPRLLLQAASQQAKLFTSVALLAELADILSRPKFDRKVAASLLTVDRLVGGYASLARVVRPAPVPRIVGDPDDDVVIGTAIGADAGLIVTGDQALLAVSQYQGVRIVSVAEAMQALRSGADAPSSATAPKV